MDIAIFLGILTGTIIKIAILGGIIYLGYRLIQKLIEYRVDYEQERKTTKDTETEIYKTAAEIEHHLNEDKP